MCNRSCIYELILWMVLLTPAQAGDPSAREYEVKAGFLYNFTTFVEWSKEKQSEANEAVVIGIIGKDPFGNIFDPLKNKKVNQGHLIIKRFQGLQGQKKSADQDEDVLAPDLEVMQPCHILFVCRSERDKLATILDMVKDSHVLTVGEWDGFLEAGGILNFIMEENKVRFEINMAAAKRADLKIRSKLLRLARRLIERDNAG